jgi:hypothetical protein
VQQLPAIVGIETATAAGIEQVIGAGHSQEKMAREIYTDQGDFQALLTNAACGRKGVASS